MAGAVACDAPLRFGLRVNRGMAHDAGIRSNRRSQTEINVRGNKDGCRIVRALLQRSPKRGLRAGRGSLPFQTRHALMLAILPAARRQVCLTLGRCGKERRDKRQAKDGQQQNGDQFPQCSSFKH